jgi:hypothetical protein
MSHKQIRNTVMAEGVKLLNTIQDVYLDQDITIA